MSSEKKISLLKISFIVVSLLVFLIFISILFFRYLALPYLLGGTAAVTGNTTAPSGTIDERQAWAKTSFGTYWDYVEKWILSSSRIDSQTGPIIHIAPIGTPNFYQSCFTDGCHAVMKLEVQGQDGSGLLVLPQVRVSNYTSPEYSLEHLGKASWTFAGVAQRMELTGLPTSDDYNALLKTVRIILETKSPAKTVSLYESIDESLTPIVEPTKSRLKELYGRALAELGRKDEASGVLMAAALEIAAEARNLEIPRPNQIALPDFQAQASRYRKAHEILAAAYTANPEIAKIRWKTANILTEARNAKHELRFSFSTPELPPDDRVAWAEKYLSVFYESAKEMLQRSNTIRKEIGSLVSIIPTEKRQNNVELSKDGYYHAFLHLTVRGTGGTLYAELFIEESKRTLPPVDLFSLTPREPIRKLRVRQARWGRKPNEVTAKLID